MILGVKGVFGEDFSYTYYIGRFFDGDGLWGILVDLLDEN